MPAPTHAKSIVRPPRRWRAIRAFCVPVITIVATLSVSTNATASAGNCAYDYGGFDGYQQTSFSYPSSYFEGASAFIVVEPGSLCSIPPGEPIIHRGISTWIMIAGGSGSHNAWAQVGWTRNSEATTMQWFSQYNDNDGHLYGKTQYNIDAQIGVRHAFHELYNPSTGFEDSMIDNVHWDSSPFDIYTETSWGATPYRPEFYDEASDSAEMVDGSVNAPVAYTAVGAQRESDDVDVLMPCVMSAGSLKTSWHHLASSCNAFDMWST